jgi:hypothetical protein
VAAGNRFTAASAHRLGGAAARMGDPGRRVFGNRAIANVALQSQFGQARFHGGFFGSAWPWWRGGLVLGWFGPLFWPYAHYDLFDYVYWPYAYDDFWPYAYDDVYYGLTPVTLPPGRLRLATRPSLTGSPPVTGEGWPQGVDCRPAARAGQKAPDSIDLAHCCPAQAAITLISASAVARSP